MRADNIKLLKSLYNDKYVQLKELQEANCEHILKDQAQNGMPSLIYKSDGNQSRLHSTFDPAYEAKIILEKYENVESYDYVVFFGAGLGYLVDAFNKMYPGKKIYIHEPDPNLFIQYLDTFDLPAKDLKGLNFGTDEADLTAFFQGVIQNTKRRILIIEHPVISSIFAKEHKQFMELMQKFLKDKRVGIHTRYSFQKRWTFNSMVNFGSTLGSPNILMGTSDLFKDKPAILVAAGPSLNDEIENLRYIKENGLAYIFSVGTAVNTLIHNGIYPDATCTYDPTKDNMKVFKKIVKGGIADIPLIYGTSTAYEVVRDYPGKKIHMLTSQDTVSGYFLKSSDGSKIESVSDAPTIAIVTLQLLMKLGFETIYMVGQNLAFRNDQEYADGIDYIGKDSAKDKGTVIVKDVYGDDVKTSESFNRMRLNFEHLIGEYQKVYPTEIVNTTKGGAAIKGTEFVELEKIVETKFHQRVVHEDWVEKELIPKRFAYDRDFMQERREMMTSSYSDMIKLIKQTEKILNEIRKLARNRNFSGAEKKYHELNGIFQATKKNAYFTRFINPMNRVYYEFLNEEFRFIKEEKNEMKKAEMIIKEFSKFFNKCIEDLNTVNVLYREMNKSISAYIKVTDEK